MHASGLLVGSYLMMQEYEQGDSAGISAIQAFPEGVTTNNPAMLSLYGNWARCRYYLQRYLEAAELYEKMFALEARKPKRDSSLLQRLLTDITLTYRASGQFDKMLASSERSLAMARALRDTSNQAYVLRALGSYYTNFGDIRRSDSLRARAVYLLENCSTASTEELFMAHSDYGSVRALMGYPEEGLKYKKLSLQEIEQVVGKRHPYYAIGLTGMVVIYKRMERYEEAKALALEGLEIYRSTIGEQRIQVANLYQSLSTIHMRLGEFELGLGYQEKSIAIREAILGPNHPDMINFYGNRGWDYMQMERYAQSAAIYEETIALAEQKEHPNQYAIAFMENYLGQNYEELGRFSEAIAVHRSSLARKRGIFVPTHNEIGSSLRNLGKAFQEMGQMDSAWHYLEQAIQAAAMGEPISRRDYASSLFAGADWAYANQQYRKALSLIAQTETQLDPQSLLWQMESLEIRSLEFDAYKALGEYEAALEVVDKTDELIARLIPRLQASESQLRLKQQARALYLQGVEICYQLYQKNKNEALLWRAFRYSEAAKARVLAIQIHQLRLPNIPPKIASLEAKLKMREQYLRRVMVEMERSAKPDPEEVKRLQSALVEVRFEADSLYERIKTDYPDLYALRVRPPSLNHRMLQSQLKADQVFWEYLVGEKRVWAFVIDRERIQLHELALSSVRETVPAFREAVQKREKTRWKQLANQLYNDLVEPVLDTSVREIILVPDDVLAYLPFEALITETVSNNEPINQYPFWLRTHEISYAYSALLWTRGRLGASSNGGKLLSVAPAFDAPQFAQTGQRGLGPLLENQGEAQAASELWGGKALLGEAASLQTFRAESGRYQILHLATHGKINEQAPGESFLAFYGEADTFRFAERSYPQLTALYLEDIYALPCRADLVVLSACETGIGKLYEGEGIASLARAFVNVGARSVLNTLWSVSDEGSSQLMQGFYTNLKAGQSRAAALRNAKLELMRSRPDLAEPFYWASYVLIGDERPMPRQQSERWIWGLLGLIGFALGAGLIATRRENSI